MIEDKFFIGYIWFLTVLGGIFLGNEIGMMKNNFDRGIANKKLTDCNTIIYSRKH
jgi:hypothetical protein